MRCNEIAVHIGSKESVRFLCIYLSSVTHYLAQPQSDDIPCCVRDLSTL
jgi:hypothetical protein